MIESNLSKPCKEPTDTHNSDEIVSDTDEDKGEWPLLEEPMPEVFDQDESEIDFCDDESFSYSANICQNRSWGNSDSICCSKIGITDHNIPKETPCHHHRMGHDESHKNLEEDHHCYLGSLRHVCFRWHREIPNPDLPDRSDGIVPEPTEDEEYQCPSCEDTRMREGGEHESEEVHRWEWRI